MNYFSLVVVTKGQPYVRRAKKKPKTDATNNQENT